MEDIEVDACYRVCYCVIKEDERLDPTVSAVNGHSSATSDDIAVGTRLGDVIKGIKQDKGVSDVYWLHTKDSVWRNLMDRHLGATFPEKETIYLKFVAKVPPATALQADVLLPLTCVLQKLDTLADSLSMKASATRSASGINADDFQLLCRALNIVGPLSEDKDGNSLEEDADVLEQLLGDDRFWDQRYEEQQRARYCKVVEGWMASKKSQRSIRWVNGNRETICRRFEGLHFTVSSKNDLVAVLKNFGQLLGQGAVLGVELRRKILTRRSLRQALMEFFLWADASCFPFVQLITDMQKGGVAFYCKRIDAVTGIELRQVVLRNMNEVEEFVSNMGLNLPTDLGDDGPDGGLILRQSLAGPPRKKLKQIEKSTERDYGEGRSTQQTGLERATKGQIALWTIGARFLENDGDVANLADLDSFEQEVEAG